MPSFKKGQDRQLFLPIELDQAWTSKIRLEKSIHTLYSIIILTVNSMTEISICGNKSKIRLPVSWAMKTKNCRMNKNRKMVVRVIFLILHMTNNNNKFAFKIWTVASSIIREDRINICKAKIKTLLRWDQWEMSLLILISLKELLKVTHFCQEHSHQASSQLDNTMTIRFLIKPSRQDKKSIWS